MIETRGRRQEPKNPEDAHDWLPQEREDFTCGKSLNLIEERNRESQW